MRRITRLGDWGAQDTDLRQTSTRELSKLDSDSGPAADNGLNNLCPYIFRSSIQAPVGHRYDELLSPAY